MHSSTDNILLNCTFPLIFFYTNYTTCTTKTLNIRSRRKRHIRCIYPFEGDLRAICGLAKSSKSILEEFIRATTIDPRKLVEGVPEILLPSFEISLRTLLSQVGVPGGLSHDLVGTMKVPAQAEDPIVCVLSFLIIVSNACIPKTRLAKFNRLPSDQTLQSLANFYYGTWLYISWVTLNQNLYRRIIQWASRPITFTYSMREVAQGKHLEWDWATHRSYKKLDKLAKPDLAARVIRVFAGRFPHTRSPDITDQNISNVNKIVKRVNQFLGTTGAWKHTGVMYPLWGVFDRRSLESQAVDLMANPLESPDLLQPAEETDKTYSS